MRRETGGDEHNKELEKKKRRFQIMSFPYLSLMCACSLSYVGPCSVTLHGCSDSARYGPFQ